jgi:hypothetical protein
MTKEELYLVKELIREVVKSTVKEVLLEEQKSSNVKKDLKEVKLLLAKVIKEGMVPKNNVENKENLIELRQKLRESVGEDFDTIINRTSYNVSPKLAISSEKAVEIAVNGTLPDFDAPIPNISKDSPIWKELKERVG